MRLLKTIKDPVLYNLVRFSIARARMRFIKPVGRSEHEWREQLPTAPFDLAFFTSLVQEIFSRREILDRIERGESLDVASDWDV